MILMCCVGACSWKFTNCQESLKGPAVRHNATNPSQPSVSSIMRIDTEFNEYHGALVFRLLIVAESGGSWYGVCHCDDQGWWKREHMMPHLNREPARDANLRRELAEFLAQYDSVHIVSTCPEDIANFCNFLEYTPGERIGSNRMTFEVRRDLPDTAAERKR